jgi:probable phosphoglycerate mutase
MVRLILMRHGETEWAKLGKHTGRTDIPLTEKGKQQADRLREIVPSLDISKTFSSPLTRAFETAQLAGMPNITKDELLLEFDYGKYEGLTRDEIRKELADWSIWKYPCPGGEALADVSNRCSKFLNRISAKESGNVGVVAHGHLLRILACTWLKWPSELGENLLLKPATLCILAHDRESPVIELWDLDYQAISQARS